MEWVGDRVRIFILWRWIKRLRLFVQQFFPRVLDRCPLPVCHGMDSMVCATAFSRRSAIE